MAYKKEYAKWTSEIKEKLLELLQDRQLKSV